MSDDVMHFRSIEQINAHFDHRRMAARRRGETAAEIERERVQTIKRRLDYEIGYAKIQALQARLRRA